MVQGMVQRVAMTFLFALTLAERTLLVRLPYRVGLYISQADTTGGKEADEREIIALTGIVRAFGTEVFGCETMQHIITETIRRQEEWPYWGDALVNVPEECRQAIKLLGAHVDIKEMSGFRGHLLEIAHAVALAYCEYGHPHFVNRFTLYMAWMSERGRHTHLGALGFQSFLHISAAERRALRSLNRALEVEYKIR